MDIVHNDPILFHDGDLSATLRTAQEAVKRTVDGLSQNQLLNTTLDELVEQVADLHRVPALELHDDQAEVTQEESSIPVERMRGALFFGEGTRTVPGHTVGYHIPFSGDRTLFKLRPNKWTSNPPRGVVRGNDLVFTFQSRDVGAHLKQAYERELRSVRSYVGNQLALIEEHNGSVTAAARRLLTERIGRIQKADAGSAALGVPLRRSADAPTTYAAPDVRRRLPNAAPSGPKVRASTPAEPTLPDVEYAHILKVMRNMALVLERSPSAFEAIGEEGIRWHFIVQLNGQYEGQATGETFNFKGKTDIIIRSGPRNIFIAECKFWKGTKTFTDTIDQLLGYLTWRDTKAAIVIFNRDVQLSTVLAAVPGALSSHASCHATVEKEDETSFSTILVRPDDPERKIMLTVMVFDVPKRVDK